MGALVLHAMVAQDRDRTRRDYRESIETMADAIEREADDYDDVYEAVWESLDASSWIIYTDRSLAALRFADNEPTEWKHLVADGDSWQEVIQAMAYRAMESDLIAELREREGVDL